MRAIGNYNEGNIGNNIDRLSIFAGRIAGILILVLAFITGFEVVSRYIFNKPTMWSLEISEYLFVACGFLGASYTMLKGRHIHVEVLIGLLQPRTREFHQLITTAFVLVYSVLMTYFGVRTVIVAYQRGVASPWLEFPIWVAEVMVPIGMFLLSLQVLRILASKVETLRKSEVAKELPLRKLSLNNPLLLTPLYFGAIGLAVYLFTVNTAAGLLVGLFLMLFSGVPVFAALGLWGATALFLFEGGGLLHLSAISLIGFKSLHSFALVALAVFILTASILSRGKVGEQLFDLMSKWIGHIPGGVLIAAIFTCALFAAMCGSSAATAATVGLVAIPELLKLGYDKRMVYGGIAAGGTLGIMIPPSNQAIVYGSITDVSVGALFMAGILPGFLIVCLFAGYVLFRCRSGKFFTPQPAFSWKERFRSLGTATWGLMAPVIILGGIWIGAFTPTESGCIAVIYALIISLVVIRTMDFRAVWKTMDDCALTTCMILMIIVGAMVFGHIVTMAQIPEQAVKMVLNTGVGKWGFLMFVVLLIGVLGTILEGISITLITMPILWPAILHFGLDPVWFGIVFTLLIEIGLITPPVGMNLFVLQGVSGDTLWTIVRGVAPFVLLMAVGLAIILYFQPISLILPELAGL